MVATRAVIGATVTGMVVGAGFTVMIAGAAEAATIAESRSVVAGEDAYVSSTRTGSNFGDAEKLVVGTETGETRSRT